MNCETPLDRFYRGGTCSKLEAAANLAIDSRYDVNLGFLETLLDRFEFDRARGVHPVNLAISLFRISFRLGYLQGGRAALNGKFQNPPRRRKVGNHG